MFLSFAVSFTHRHESHVSNNYDSLNYDCKWKSLFLININKFLVGLPVSSKTCLSMASNKKKKKKKAPTLISHISFKEEKEIITNLK